MRSHRGSNNFYKKIAGVSDATGFMTQTTGVLHVYADGTNGSDTYDGSAAAWVTGTLIGPKKTLQAVFDLVPFYVRHNVCVHLAGTFSEFGSVGLRKFIFGGAVLVDGGPGLTTIADNSGNPWSADITSTSSIGLTTAGWSVDAYAGYLVEVVSGPAAGQHRMIQGNSATTITPARNFSVDPGAGAQFRISRPTTTLSASSTTSMLYLLSSATSFYGPTNVNDVVCLQNIYLTGSKAYINHSVIDASIRITYVISDSSAGFVCSGKSYVQYTGARLNPTTFAAETAATYSCAGIGIRGATNYLQFINLGNSSLYASFVAGVQFAGTTQAVMAQGSRALWANYASCSGPLQFSFAISNTTGYASTKLGPYAATPVLTLKDSNIRIGPGVDISGAASHAIECNHSHLHLDGAVTGSGNTGAGVYAHSGSVVHIKNAAPPTLTGTVGDLSFDGTTEATEWATVDAGTPAVSSAELSMCKEVA